jgi:hypothetical protein
MPQTTTVGSIVLSEDRSQVSRWTLTASSKGCASTRQDGTVNLSMGAAPDGKAELPGRTCWNVPRQVAVFLEERVCPVIKFFNLRNVCTHGGRGDKILPHQHPADDEAYDNEHDAHFSELEAACAISLVSLTLPENS